jgi:4-alpha-glucanotransferase
MEASGGAPPDIVFTRGQNWGFPPLHPDKLRQQGYRYYVSCLQHHLRHAGILRIDHVMNLHRLFWIPKGMEAGQGAYVNYRPEEFYAILTLESQRNKTVIVGEDLGTVPSYVRQSMNKYGLHRMYVLQYELMSDSQKSLRKVPKDVVASMDTHDMPPFAAFWQGLDIEDRLELTFLDKATARMERKNRDALKKALVSYLRRQGWLNDSTPEAVLEACWTLLGASTARVVLVNLEDLWLERESQNVPATGEKRNNWQKKARFALESFCNMPRVNETLQALNQLRKYPNKGG